ncbi:MAG: hypothetical protein ACKO25_06385 [Cyanobium sp.]
MVFLHSRRFVFGTTSYWRHRRRVVIDRLRSQGCIARVGPAGQVYWQRHVGRGEARRWWRRVEPDPRGWSLALLLGLAIGVHLHLQARLPPTLVGFGAALPMAGFALTRAFGRPPGYGPDLEF